MAKPLSEASTILGSRIRAVRLDLGISQMDLAELAGMHFTNVAKIERGEANPNFTTIVRIASALNTDPGLFITGISSAQLPNQQHQLTAAEFLAARAGTQIN